MVGVANQAGGENGENVGGGINVIINISITRIKQQRIALNTQ